jgi:hypothetical protein
LISWVDSVTEKRVAVAASWCLGWVEFGCELEGLADGRPSGPCGIVWTVVDDGLELEFEMIGNCVVSGVGVVDVFEVFRVYTEGVLS